MTYRPFEVERIGLLGTTPQAGHLSFDCLVRGRPLPLPLASSFNLPLSSTTPLSLRQQCHLRTVPLQNHFRRLTLRLSPPTRPPEGDMAASLVSLPPLPQSPLPLSPPCSPGSSRHDADYSPLTPRIETPTRSPLTSASLGTTASIDSTIMAHPSQETASAPAEEPVMAQRPNTSTSPPSPPPAPSKSPVKLEDFELIRVLGKGCAGRVSFGRRV